MLQRREDDMDVRLTNGISPADGDRPTHMNWIHGANGLLHFALSRAGVRSGLIVGRAPVSRLRASPLLAIPIFVVSLLLWPAMARRIDTTAIARNLIPYLALIFIGMFSGLAGKFFAIPPENRNHKRGSAGHDVPKVAEPFPAT